MDIPKKGWFIRKAADKPAHLSKVYFNGERVGFVQQVKIGVDAEYPLITLELKLTGMPLQVDVVQDLEAQQAAAVPVEIPDASGREPLTGQEASDMLDAAFKAEQRQKAAS